LKVVGGVELEWRTRGSCELGACVVDESLEYIGRVEGTGRHVIFIIKVQRLEGIEEIVSGNLKRCIIRTNHQTLKVISTV
jgi:hypothetical protein